MHRVCQQQVESLMIAQYPDPSTAPLMCWKNPVVVDAMNVSYLEMSSNADIWQLILKVIHAARSFRESIGLHPGHRFPCITLKVNKSFSTVITQQSSLLYRFVGFGSLVKIDSHTNSELTIL